MCFIFFSLFFSFWFSFRYLCVRIYIYLYIQGASQYVEPTAGVNRGHKNNEKSSHMNMSPIWLSFELIATNISIIHNCSMKWLSSSCQRISQFFKNSTCTSNNTDRGWPLSMDHLLWRQAVMDLKRKMAINLKQGQIKHTLIWTFLVVFMPSAHSWSRSHMIYFVYRSFFFSYFNT